MKNLFIGFIGVVLKKSRVSLESRSFYSVLDPKPVALAAGCPADLPRRRVEAQPVVRLAVRWRGWDLWRLGATKVP